MITDADIKKMKAVFATKADLEGMATKGDLKGMATKRDLKGMATKEELKGMATKAELKALDSKMDLGFSEIIKFIGETRNEIVGLLSKQIEELKDIVYRHQMTLENHDSRIAHLEYANKS